MDLLSVYRILHKRLDVLTKEKVCLERELNDNQSRMAMLQCQNFILGDQARGYQTVVEKAAVRCAKCKYRKLRGKVNAKKVHAVIATAGPDWDLDTWDGDIWDDTDDDVD